MEQFALLLLAIVQLVVGQTVEYTPIRTLKNGQIRGLVQEIGNGRKVEFYQGIKYGKVQRFEQAQPADSWTGVYEAVRPRDACPQFGHHAGRVNPSLGNVTFAEDCLYLNIWRPHEEATVARPVMVFIHGGAFEAGTIFAKGLDASNIAVMGDLVVVSISYRLGPLGFLAANEAGDLSNLGLHDQIRGLKWVKENVHVFGGDSNQVTIFGGSAGAFSVGSLVTSPLARGLFHRAIAQSGAPTPHFMIDSPARALKRTKEFAKKAHCPVGALLNETIHCLKGKSIAELQEATNNDLATNRLFLPVFGDELLPFSKPSVALKTGQFNAVDYIYGVTRNEGTLFLGLFFPELGSEVTNLTVNSTKQYIIRLLALYDEKTSLGQEVADFYVGRLPDNPTQDDLKKAISDVWGDFIIVCPSILFGEELAKHLPLTKHVFAYRVMQVSDSPVTGWKKWMGVTHGTDGSYLFALPGDNHTTAFTDLSQMMVLDWTTFARTSRPHSTIWTEAFNRENDDFSTRYLHLEAGHFTMVEGHFKETCEKFWKAKIFD